MVTLKSLKKLQLSHFRIWALQWISFYPRLEALPWMVLGKKHGNKCPFPTQAKHLRKSYPRLSSPPASHIGRGGNPMIPPHSLQNLTFSSSVLISSPKRSQSEEETCQRGVGCLQPKAKQHTYRTGFLTSYLYSESAMFFKEKQGLHRFESWKQTYNQRISFTMFH